MTIDSNDHSEQLTVQSFNAPMARLSERLRRSPGLLKAFYSGWAALMLAFPFIGSTLHHFRLANFPGDAVVYWVAWTAILVFTLVHEAQTDWYDRMCQLYGKKNPPTSEALAFFKSLVSSRFATKVIGLACGVSLLAVVEQASIAALNTGGLFKAIIPSLFIALLLPVAATATVALIRQQAKRGPLQKAINSLCSTRLPYLSIYAGSFLFLAGSVFLPEGIGSAIARWLTACAVDAKIGSGVVSPGMVLGVSTVFFLMLFSSLSPLIIRLSAGYQLLVTRTVVNGDGILDALLETVNVQRTVITLPETHVHVRNIFSILAWLSICYAALFSLVAFCPPPLGDTLLGWLSACVRDSHAGIDLSTHMNLRLFLASIFAGYGAVPVAMTTCAFLPARKPKAIIVSAQGILSPTSFGNLVGLSPLRLWGDLKKVTLVGSKNQTLKLSFPWGDTINLPLKDLEPQQVNELLASADEYAVNCKFDAATIALRTKLLQETKSDSITDAAKFTSTIFSPRKSGDYLGSQYRVVRKLAGKALSAVYLTRDAADKHVVIKEFVLPSSAQQRDRMVTTFEREFKILSSLKHEGIAQVKEMFEENDARYIAIEYVQGTDLRTTVERRGSRSESTVIKWASSIAQIMLFLHEQDPPVLHRDLTPDNLMEDVDGDIKLIDFGAAHQFMEGVTGTLIGKQCYIAPEQLRGAPSKRSDIYSFGCTLYFLLAGEDPPALQQSELPPDVAASPKLRDLIKRCTHFDEEERYGSFAEVLQDLGCKVQLKTAQHEETLLK